MLPVIVVAVALRRRCPANAPSPKNAPAVRIPTTASRPSCDITVNFTRPFWMYITAAQGSPWAKMVSKGLKRTLVFSMCNASSSLPVFPPDARVFFVLI